MDIQHGIGGFSNTQLQAGSVGNEVAYASNRKGVSCHYLPRWCVVNGFAARTTPPAMQRVSKRLPTPQKSCNIEITHRVLPKYKYTYRMAGNSAESVCSHRKKYT